MEWRVLLWVGEQLVSHVGIAPREVAAGDRSIAVGGLGWVGTLPEWRERGLGAAAMRRAASVLRDDLKLPFGLLVCHEPTVAFYRKLGWQRVAGPLRFDQPAGPVEWPDATMVLPSGAAAWPPGPIDLWGLLF